MCANSHLHRLLLAACLLALLSATPRTLQAAIPDNDFFFGPINGTYLSIYDISGTYHIEDSIPMDEDPPLDFSFDITLMQDAKGKLSGTGMTMIEFEQLGDEVDEVPAFYEVKGKVKTAGDLTFIDLKIKTSGSGPFLGIVQNYSIQMKTKAIIDPENDLFFGNNKGKAKASALGSAKFGDFIIQDLPGDMDGSWFMDMYVRPDGAKLTGTTDIRLSNGRTLPFILKGSYNEPSDLAKISLTGTGDALGSKINRVITGASGAALLAFKGKVMGQTIVWEAAFP